MASEPPPTPPASGPPPQPAHDASPQEWRAWRHQMRDYWRAQGRGSGWYGPYGPWSWWGGGWFWGAALVLIGAYYLLRNTGVLNWLPGDVLWPALLILFGVYLLVRRNRGWWP